MIVALLFLSCRKPKRGTYTLEMVGLNTIIHNDPANNYTNTVNFSKTDFVKVKRAKKNSIFIDGEKWVRNKDMVEYSNTTTVTKEQFSLFGGSYTSSNTTITIFKGNIINEKYIEGTFSKIYSKIYESENIVGTFTISEK